MYSEPDRRGGSQEEPNFQDDRLMKYTKAQHDLALGLLELWKDLPT